MTTDAPTTRSSTPRFRVFVDYWNIQITLNQRDGQVTGELEPRFKLAWARFGGWVAQKAADIAAISDYVYDGTIIYTSYNPKDTRFKNWVSNWLNRQPGIQVVALERRPKAPPTCPSCHSLIETCPQCSVPITAMAEKGVDTQIATDMIRLAWESAYDVAVLCSLDSDLVPAVRFLDQKGLKVIQAGFPPAGAHLSTACWASLDLFPLRDEFRRT